MTKYFLVQKLIACLTKFTRNISTGVMKNTRMAIITIDPQDLLNTITQEEECRDRELEWKRGNGHFLQICSVLRKAKRIN